MAAARAKKANKVEVAEPIVCGLIMPICEIDGMPAARWSDVRRIFEEAAEAAGFKARMVSESDETSVIHKSIIQNLYTDEIAICDVSGLNSNVMFELGMRLAFDKPTVVVKDDKIRFSFDTSPIQHVGYRRDLRFEDIRQFILELSNKLKSTHSASQNDPSYSPFVRNFGSFKLPQMATETVAFDVYAVEQLKMLEKSVSRLGAKISALEAASSADSARRVVRISTGNALAPGYRPNALAGLDSALIGSPSQGVDLGAVGGLLSALGKSGDKG